MHEPEWPEHHRYLVGPEDLNRFSPMAVPVSTVPPENVMADDLAWA